MFFYPRKKEFDVKIWNDGEKMGIAPMKSKISLRKFSKFAPFQKKFTGKSENSDLRYYNKKFTNRELIWESICENP